MGVDFKGGKTSYNDVGVMRLGYLLFNFNLFAYVLDY